MVVGFSFAFLADEITVLWVMNEFFEHMALAFSRLNLSP